MRTLGAFVTAINNGAEEERGGQNLGLVAAMVTRDRKNETECLACLATLDSFTTFTIRTYLDLKPLFKVKYKDGIFTF